VSVINRFRRSKKLHAKNFHYIQKEGKGRDGEFPSLFGFVDGYESRMDELNFRTIISPENQNVDLQVLTKEFIRRLNQQTCLNLDWVAAEHFDTKHRHVHILINGKDRYGKPVMFNPSFMKEKMRDIARNITTEMNGERSQYEIDQALRNSCVKNRYTNIDRIINRSIVDFSISRYEASGLENGSLLCRRLNHLVSLNLCAYDKTTAMYKLKPEWESELKLYGKYSNYLTGLHESGVHSAQYGIHHLEKEGSIKGRVLTWFYMQQGSNEHAVVVQKEDGSVRYVPLPVAPEKLFEGENIYIVYQGNVKSKHGKGRGEVTIQKIN
jgi:hypothetical protein